LQYRTLKFNLLKPLFIVISFFFFFQPGVSAQLLQVKNSLEADIASVISDYPNGFKNLAGEITKNNPQSTEFDCKASVKGANSCQVIKYSSSKKEIYSWEAEMLKTDDFEEAAKKFRSIYTSLEHLSVDVNGIIAVFKGVYVKPTSSIKFTTITFETSDKTPELEKLKITLMLEAEMLDWIIKIQVFEKEKEDVERGPQIEN